MKIIQTFWSGPDEISTQEAVRNSAGWLSPEFHWMSWALSVLQLKRLGYMVELYTDQVGKDIFSKIFHFPYDKIIVSLEGSLSHYPRDLFALAKLHTYKNQEQPFIHLDGDVFLYKQFDDRLLSSPLIAQNLEVDLFFYREILNEVRDRKFVQLPETLKPILSDSKIFAANAGIFGGNNISFIREYCADGFAFIDANSDRLDQVNTSQLNFLIEQCQFFYKAKATNTPITFFMDDAVDHPLYKDYAKFCDVPNVEMIHTVGGFKKFDFICDHLAKRLRRDFPSEYYDIINICKANNITLRHKFYHYFNRSEQQVPKSFWPIREANQSINPERAFRRTLGIVHGLEPGRNQTVENLPQFLNSLSDQRLRERITDIFEFESRKQELEKQWLLNLDPSNHYESANRRYDGIQEIFLLPDVEFFNTEVMQNPQLKIIDSGWNWDVPENVSFELLMKERLNEDKTEQKVFLLPDILLLNYKEAYYDSLDSLVIEASASTISIGDLFENMKQFFEPEEIENDTEGFRTLIIDTLKRLMYDGVLIQSQPVLNLQVV